MAEYYVDSDVGGPGTGTFIDPWDDIASNVATLGPNDRMNIRGDVGSHRIYTESPITCGNSGTNGSPIMIQPYLAELVTIKTTPEESSKQINITGDWWEIGGALSRLKFDKDYIGGGSSHVQFDGSDHIVLQNLEMIQNGGDGAIITSPTNGANYITIDDVTISDAYKGIGQDAAGVLINGSTHLTIKNSTMFDIRGSCVQAWDGGLAISDTIVEDNHFYVSPALQRCCEGAVTFKRGSPIIRRNIMHGWRSNDGTCGGTGGGLGGAITLYMLVGSGMIEENVIYDCSSGLTVSSNDGIVTIRRNIIRDLVTDAETWINAGLYIHHNPALVRVYNNTFHELPEHLFYFGANADAVLRNNICNETHDIHEDGTADVDADYNGWFNVVDSLVGAHDVTGSDPGFKDAANDNYRLRRSSAAINAGVDVGLSYRGSAPDLGYKEHRGFVIASTWV